MRLIAAAPWSSNAPPLDPGAADARAQLAHELGKAGYQSAKPTLAELIEKALTDWLNSLTPAGPGGAGVSLGLIVVIFVAVAVIVVGFLIFGVPRLNRRSSRLGSLFGEDDERDSVTLRRAADVAAASGDYATAIAEGFRAIARGLAERTIVTTFPGTTAHGFAQRAALSFPASSGALALCADAFDGVRYLGSAGSESDWLATRALETELQTARPVRNTEFAGAPA